MLRGWTISRPTARTGTRWRGFTARTRYYDTEALVAGEDVLGDVESAAVGDVAGLDVLHLQSHIAFDSICLARRGARVTCVDFSGESLARARSPRGPVWRDA